VNLKSRLVSCLPQKIVIYVFMTLAANSSLSADVIPNITGTWLFNQELSDDVQKKIKEQMKSARSERDKPDSVSGATSKNGGNGSGSRGRPSEAGQHDRPDKKAGRESMQQELAKTLLFAKEFQITQHEPEIIMTFPDSEQRIIHTDGRGITITASGYTSNPMGPYIAGWDEDNQLTIETTTSSGMMIEELITLSSDGSQLHARVNFKLPKLDNPIETIRVYDRIQEDKTLE
jgi:hypothetical protein